MAENTSVSTSSCCHRLSVSPPEQEGPQDGCAWRHIQKAGMPGSGGECPRRQGQIAKMAPPPGLSYWWAWTKLLGRRRDGFGHSQDRWPALCPPLLLVATHWETRGRPAQDLRHLTLRAQWAPLPVRPRRQSWGRGGRSARHPLCRGPASRSSATCPAGSCGPPSGIRFHPLDGIPGYRAWLRPFRIPSVVSPLTDNRETRPRSDLNVETD